MIALISDRREAVAALCEQFHVRRLDVFGSASRGNFMPATSDIDFVVDFEPLSPVTSWDAYFGLLEGLEALFDRHIDLIMTDAVVNPYFRESLDASRECVYAA
ncbi:MAG: nucleotidyltransferase family protein [Dehalococcoidia bacterium]